MVQPTMPGFIKIKNIRFCIWPVLNITNKAFANAYGIKQNTIRVLQRVKLHLGQVVANMFCKTGAC
jgi:hypothetical protein